MGKRDSVNDDKRVVGGIQGSRASDPDARTRAGTAVSRCHQKAGDLSFEHVLCIDHCSPVYIFGFDGRDGAGHIVLLHGSVTYDDDFVEIFVILLQCHNGWHRSSLKGLGGITDAAYLYHSRRASNREGEASVRAGRSSVGGGELHYRRTDHRTVLVLDGTLYGIATLG